jgi:Tfp pilus assembly protein PilF
MPTTAQALSLGLAQHERGELAQAEQTFRQILEHEPRNAAALHALAMVGLQLGHTDEALELLDRAIAIEPTSAVFHGHLGAVLLAMGRFEPARAELERSVQCDPAHAEAHYNLGIALYNLGRVDESVASYRRCVQLQSNNASAHNNLGDVLRELGKFDEALVHLEQALAAEPRSPHAHYNRSLIWLSQGRLAKGWGEYEWRFHCTDLKQRPLAQPAWDGSSLADKTLLLHAEQGLGDTLQFIRFLPQVRRRCRDVVVEVQPSLVPLLRQSGFDGLIAHGSPLPRFDVQLPMLSLGRALGVTLETIPRDVPYLQANAELVERWRADLSGLAGFKVGIAWQGAPTYREDRYRSIPLAAFAPLARVPGVELVSLQKGPGVEQISMLGGSFHVVDLGSRLDERSGPFMDTAAIMKNLDLVITSDTVTAHLAGALGVRVWVALRIAADWRWLTARGDSPWYPTMRLFRQKTFADWSGVFDDMSAELKRMV